MVNRTAKTPGTGSKLRACVAVLNGEGRGKDSPEGSIKRGAPGTDENAKGTSPTRLEKEVDLKHFSSRSECTTQEEDRKPTYHPVYHLSG